MEVDYFDDILSMVSSNFVENFPTFQAQISPSYLLEKPYRELLIAIARGDGKIYSAFRKAKLSEALGEELVAHLVALNVLKIETSREAPLRMHPKHKLPKEQRTYRIQDKLRFVQPFMRFWFGFVAFYTLELQMREGKRFLENFSNHYERLRSLVYEQLCDDLLKSYYHNKQTFVSSGSYWNIHSEFDILAITQQHQVILGECKYKDRTVCKNELTKLKLKAQESGIQVDTYALFSKSGFSKELLQMQDEQLLLFDLQDLQLLIEL